MFSLIATVFTSERGYIGPCICRKILLTAKLNGTISDFRANTTTSIFVHNQSSAIRSSSKPSSAQETASTQYSITGSLVVKSFITQQHSLFRVSKYSYQKPTGPQSPYGKSILTIQSYYSVFVMFPLSLSICHTTAPVTGQPMLYKSWGFYLPTQPFPALPPPSPLTSSTKLTPQNPDTTFLSLLLSPRSTS